MNNLEQIIKSKKILSFDIGVKNTAIVLLEEIIKNDKPFLKILLWQLIDFSNGKSCKSQLDITYVLSLLENFKETYSSVDEIVIENQPKMNNKAKKLSEYLHIYFNIRCKVDMCNTKVSIKFISGKVKYKIFDTCKQYTLNKKNAVKCCTLLLKDKRIDILDECLQTFEITKKKDDLSDSLLLALSCTKWLELQEKMVFN